MTTLTPIITHMGLIPCLRYGRYDMIYFSYLLIAIDQDPIFDRLYRRLTPVRV